MLFRLLADITVSIHLLFIVFVITGGLFALKWHRIVWLHVPAAIWAAIIEFFGYICPLTPLENWLRFKGGEAGYPGGFIERYIIPLIYPSGLTRDMQITLGIIVIAVNLLVYGYIIIQSRAKQK